MSKRVFITGLGAISAIGGDVPSSLASLLARKTGIGTLQNIKTRLAHLPVGEVKLTTNELKTLAGVPANIPHSRTDLLGIIAAKEAVKNAQITDISEFKTGLISATSVGGMSTTEQNWTDYLDESKSGDFLSEIESHEGAYSTEKIADSLGIKAYLNTISTACSSSSNAILLGARLIKNGLLDRVVAGGTDALSKFTMNGFNTLMILDESLCKPFDDNRKGLNLGEGAGFVVLESEKASEGKERLAELVGYANTNDAYHQTASSPTGEGAYLAISETLKLANVKPSEVSYINAHGTGTSVNDLSEGTAIERVFGSKVPPISSTKVFTGHTLGACGGIEAVFSVLAIKNGLIFPNLNFSTPMSELAFKPNLTLLKNQSINFVLSNSFGFGGNTTSLLFSKV
ncbi:beta-ketoacyl-[acyl-carrier-protein] synthase family protein [uncultured Arcticibacterium sp.]|uniref:beta-ketoacyl-[acyl-carrier-protein] synthase family protein n=1 Tax=uncultured Arcticibacterium sp. TaxID=2173042 RepID=UPI0030F66710